MGSNTDQLYVYATGGIIASLVLFSIFRRDFDPFAPIWLFLAGFTQVYVVQALSYRDYALRVRGYDLTCAANARAFWALLWFLTIYYSGLGKFLARRLPAAPRTWSIGLVGVLAPLLLVWGLACAGMVMRLGHKEGDQVYMSAEQQLLLQFPTVQLVAAVMLIVTGRQPSRPRPALTALGVATALGYTLIWMLYGRRSHALFGVLTCIASFYLPRFKRPSLATLGATAFIGSLVVALALGWRGYMKQNPGASFADFGHFATSFDPNSILVSLNLKEPPGSEGLATQEALSRETEEYGGFLLMMATVPQLSPYDHGESYLRLVSTYIPRFIWRNKPYFGRAKWLSAWQAGSEFERNEKFTGPAISILGAAQLNGGALGTLLVVGVIGLLTRSAYDYYRYHADTPWAQVWWSLTYFNAWLMTVNDDPFVWFYYLYGHTIFPPIVLLWLYNRLAGGNAA
jgi:hypothetical protein